MMFAFGGMILANYKITLGLYLWHIAYFTYMAFDKQTKYPVENYDWIYTVNPYYGGNFCCIGKPSNRADINTLLLFKNNKIEAEIDVDVLVEQVAVHNDNVYYLSLSIN